jgi:hypothetical protein
MSKDSIRMEELSPVSAALYHAPPALKSPYHVTFMASMAEWWWLRRAF